jgi:pimeloyl-ACP methyl ester carboxylesterase
MAVEYLESEGGKISYEDSHSHGPLVVLITPMGSLRSVYRFLAPALVSEGYRVLVQDLRGHGDSSTGWEDYSISAHGRDLLALIRRVDAGPAFVVGNSYSGGVAVWAAAEAPELVAGIALVGAFVRNVDSNPLKRALLWVLLAGPWGPTVWMSYYPKLYPTRCPDDFAEHLAETRRSMNEAGRFAAFRKIGAAPKDDSEERLGEVAVPALVIMGTADPDFPDPQAEASFQADAVGGTKVMIEGAGHHPQADSPTEVAAALTAFMAALS